MGGERWTAFEPRGAGRRKPDGYSGLDPFCPERPLNRLPAPVEALFVRQGVSKDRIEEVVRHEAQIVGLGDVDVPTLEDVEHRRLHLWIVIDRRAHV